MALKAAPVSSTTNTAMIDLHPSAIASGGTAEQKRGNLIVMGHRGCGMNVMQSPDSRMRAFKENSIASFNVAASFSRLQFVEFDVQVTKDDCPIIFHDNFILTQPHEGALVERRVIDLTLDEFLSYGPQKVSGKVGKPLLKKTKDGRVVEWIVDKDDALCTLEEVFTRVNESLGFDIELKFDDFMVYEEQELRRTLRLILDVVDKYAKDGQRPIIFSSFQPDAARLMRQMQATYPVFFITKGGIEIFNDPRRNSLEEAVNHCLDAGLQGIVSEVKAVFNNLGMVAKIKECKLSLLTYGQLNNVVEAVYLQHLMGIDGVVVDFVRDITEAVSGFGDKSTAKVGGEKKAMDEILGNKEGKEEPEFFENELAFLSKMIPELVQS